MTRFSRLIFPAVLSPAFCFAELPEFATAKAPAAPSNLSVKAVGVNSFLLKWKDNSDNEAGWEIKYSIKGSTIPTQYITLAVPNQTSHVVLTSEFLKTDFVFQIRSYNYVDGKQIFSKYTSTVTAKTPSVSTFGPPTGLKVKVTGDGSARLSWVDHSNSETAYSLEYKKGGTKQWELLGNVNPSDKFKIDVSGLLPSKSYSFRVQGIRGTTFTKYSNSVSAKTQAFKAPSNLSVTAVSDGVFSFKWKDNSTTETGYQVQKKEGTGSFEILGTTASNTSSASGVTGFALNKDHQFRIRSYKTIGTKTTFSAFSNTVQIKSTTLAKPTDVAAVVVDDTSITVNWKDQSKRESSQRVQYRKAGTNDAFTDAVAASNAQTFTVSGLVPGTLYEFRVAAVVTDTLGAVTGIGTSASVEARTKDGIGGNLNPPIFHGVSFSYDVEISRASELTSLAVTDLPTGLEFDSVNRRITGTVEGPGVKIAKLAATFNDGRTVNRNLTLRVVRPPEAPVIAAAFGAVNVAVNGTSPVSLTGKFADPDTPSATRFVTTKGDFDIILYSQAAPATVDNFLDYVDGDRYDNTFFHRSVDDAASQLVILQGGGYKYASATGFTQVSKFTGTIANEPGISNVRGSVALAKLGSAPNSGSSEFFVNLDDVNAPNLDLQNGGFTVFGRVPESGLAVLDSILELPTKGYPISGFSSAIFNAVPMNAVTAPAAMEPSKLVKITSASAAPILTYEVSSLNETVATATVSGATITVRGVAAGTTSIVVKATDLDGNSVSQNIAVTVN